MAYIQEQIEWLWQHGKMPDWAYFQQNGKSAQSNYALATQRAKQRILDTYYQQQEEARKKKEEKEIEKQLEKQIEKQLEESLEKVLDDLLKGFNK